MAEMICPMFQEECRYCSLEHTTRPFTRIERDPTTKMYVQKGIGKTEVELGPFCNNHSFKQSGWIDEMYYCPARWGLHRGKGTTVQVPEKRKPGRSAKVRVMEVRKQVGQLKLF